MGIVRYRGVLYPGKHELLLSPETWQKVQELLAARNFAGEKQREHRHYLKGSVYCGSCGSRLVVSHAKNRHGTVYEYLICVGRQQKRTTCTQRAIRIDHTEDSVVAEYANIRLTADQAEQVRDLSSTRSSSSARKPMLSANARAGDSGRCASSRRNCSTPIMPTRSRSACSRPNRPGSRVKSWLPSPASLMSTTTSKQPRSISRRRSLVRECETAYREAPDRLRRQFNQAFFKRLLIDDEYNVTGELAEPFETLLGEEIRRAAAWKAEADLGRAVEEALEERNQPGIPARELAFAGVGVAETSMTVRDAQG
jgi:site-specific DNA recombinase